MAESITYSSQGLKGGKTFFRVQITYTNGEDDEETTIQFPTALGKYLWSLVSFHMVRTDGTAATWAPRLGDTAGFAADSGSEKVSYDSAAVGTAINDYWASPGVPCYLGTDYKLYFVPAFNTGTDNDATVELIFVLE